MADNKIVFDLAINTADTANSLKEVRKAIKDLKDIQLEFGEGTDEYRKASVKIGELKDRLNDANDTARVLSGNLAENVTGAFSRVATAGIGAFQAVEGAQAVFGVENEDLQKQMVKLQGLMNLSSGIKEFANIGQAAKDFKTVLVSLIPTLGAQTVATEGATVAQVGLNTAMLANPIGAVVAAVTLLVGALVLFGNTSDDTTKKLNELKEGELKYKDSVRETNLAIDRRLKTLKDNLELSKLEGKDRELRAIDIQKENALLDLNNQKQKDLGLTLIELRRLNLEYLKAIDDGADSEVIKNILRQREAALKAGTQVIVNQKKAERVIVEQAEQDKLKIEKEYSKKSIDNAKETSGEKNEIKKDEVKSIFDELYAEEEATKNYYDKVETFAKEHGLTIQQVEQEIVDIRKSGDAETLSDSLKVYGERLTRQNEYAKTSADLEKEAAEEMEAWALGVAGKEVEISKVTEQQKIDAVQNGLSTIANLAQAFAGQSAKQQEKAFKIQKAANIASAIIDTYQSATAAYKSLAGVPIVGPALGGFAAAAAVAAGLANIRRIQQQQFNAAGGGGGSANFGGGTPTGPSPTSAPVQTTVSPGQFLQFGEFKPGELTDRRVYVVESDITGIQRKVQVIEDRSKF
jgi:hypothetical protein